jgi:para-nitrobenzyl esterase
MTTRRELMGAGVAVALLPNIARAQMTPVAQAPSGRFEGDRADGVERYLGIRYASARRFEAPVPVAATPDAVVPAHAYRASCPQRGGRYEAVSEDCQFLNIWTPAAEPRAKRPVMVYFHGGAYSTGSVVTPLNDGAVLAAGQDVVVVTVNHRINALGYLYLARLDPRFADSGNLGQLDLVVALRWVRDNIAAFGGDPKRVMVFGQSGGGAKIATLMGMPAAAGLFHAAATMSGQQVTASGPLNATARTRAYLARLKVAENDLSPLLAMPVERLVDALDAVDPVLGGGLYFGPVLDMTWMTRHPFWPDPHPQSNAIPMILGNTRDETRAFVPAESDKVKGLNWDNLSERMAPEMRVDILPEWVVAQYMADYDYDLFVIGAGSGGVRASRVSAAHGAQGGGGRGISRRRHLRDPRLRAQEAARLWRAFRRGPEGRRRFGWNVPDCKFDWATLRDNVLADVDRLNGLYTRRWNHKVEIILERATVTGPHEVTLASGQEGHAKTHPDRDRRTPAHPRIPGQRAWHHLERGVPPRNPAQAHHDRGRRLYRQRVRRHLQRIRQQCDRRQPHRRDPARL